VPLSPLPILRISSTMHPPLAEHQHVQCAEVMRALKDCHSENGYMKFLGVCNDAKHALNLCLRGERIGKANENHEKAKAKRRIVEAKWKAIADES
jgi:COX assembly protein 2